MPVKIWLPWKRQVTWAVTCHIKVLPDKFWKKSLSLVAFGRIRPPPPPPDLDRVNLQ